MVTRACFVTEVFEIFLVVRLDPPLLVQKLAKLLVAHVVTTAVDPGIIEFDTHLFQFSHKSQEIFL